MHIKYHRNQDINTDIYHLKHSPVKMSSIQQYK